MWKKKKYRDNFTGLKKRSGFLTLVPQTHPVASGRSLCPSFAPCDGAAQSPPPEPGPGAAAVATVPWPGGNEQRQNQKKRENQIFCNCAGFAWRALTQALTPTLNEEKEKIHGAAHYLLHVKLRRYLGLETIRDEMINDYALAHLCISLG